MRKYLSFVYIFHPSKNKNITGYEMAKQFQKSSFSKASARALHGVKPDQTKVETRLHYNKYAEHSRVPNLKVWGDSIAEDLARLPSRPVRSSAASDSAAVPSNSLKDGPG